MEAPKTWALPLRNGSEPSSPGWRPHQVRWTAGTAQGEEPRGRHDPLHTGSSPRTHATLTEEDTPVWDGSRRTSNVGSVLDTNAKDHVRGLYKCAVRHSDCRFVEMLAWRCHDSISYNTIS